MISSESDGHFHATHQPVFVIIMRWLAGGGISAARLFFDQYLIKKFQAVSG